MESPLTRITATVIRLGAILTAASYVSSSHLVKNIGEMLVFVATFGVMAGFYETTGIDTTDHQVSVIVFSRFAVGLFKLLALPLWPKCKFRIIFLEYIHVLVADR